MENPLPATTRRKRKGKIKKPKADRLLRAAVKKFGSHDALVLRVKRSAIIARLVDTIIRNWFAGYRPNGRTPADRKVDFKLALAIRVNDAFSRPPLTTIQLARMHALATPSARTSTTWLQRIGMIKRKTARGGWVTDPDYITRTIEAPHFNRMVMATMGAAEKLKKLR